MNPLIIFSIFLLFILAKFVSTQIPIGTVIVAQQQRETTPILPISTNNNNGGANELVDQIESIDVSATQLIITTSRQGPPDMARVAIQVVDIVSGEELPHQNLTGILLVLTRGRYTVNWLRPNRWYGVLFRAEQHYSGGSAIYANEEAHLVKTHRADGSNEDNKPILSVRAQRYGDGGRSLENLVLTIRWEQHPDERTNLDAVANITLFCNDQIKYRHLRLRHNEIDKSVEIRLDNHFEVMEQKNGSARQMTASIRPKNCPRICWNAELIAEMSGGRTFRRAAAHNCQEIEAIIATAILRNYLGYKLAPNNDLIIFTDYSEPQKNNDETSSSEASNEEVNANENDAYVQLTAIVVPEPKMADNLTIRYKTFNTNKHGEEFVLDKLEKGRLYAVQYSYGKQSPFAYEESRRFLVDAGSPVQPIHLEFNLTGENGLQPGVIGIARLDPAFKQYEMGVDVEPLCERSEPAIHFWLDKDRKMRELRELRVLDALCTASPGHSICRVPGTAATIRGCGMREGKLCWTTNIVVHEKLFSAEPKCHKLADSIPQLMMTTTTTSIGTTFLGANGQQQNANILNGTNPIGTNTSNLSKNNANRLCHFIIPILLIQIFSFIFTPIFQFVIFHNNF